MLLLELAFIVSYLLFGIRIVGFASEMVVSDIVTCFYAINRPRTPFYKHIERLQTLHLEFKPQDVVRLDNNWIKNPGWFNGYSKVFPQWYKSIQAVLVINWLSICTLLGILAIGKLGIELMRIVNKRIP